jgi:hypothetical protein
MLDAPSFAEASAGKEYEKPADNSSGFSHKSNRPLPLVPFLFSPLLIT